MFEQAGLPIEREGGQVPTWAEICERQNLCRDFCSARALDQG